MNYKIKLSMMLVSFVLCGIVLVKANETQPLGSWEDTIGFEISYNSEPIVADEVEVEYISREKAETAIENAGKQSAENIIFSEVIPYPLSDEESIPCWAFVDRQLSVVYVDAWTGEILEDASPTEGLIQFLELSQNAGENRDYENYPWGFRLPISGSFRMTCGWGCGYHSGTSYYAADFANGRAGDPIYAMSGGLVLFAGWHGGGYGYEVIIQGRSAGNGKYYIYRVAHLIRQPDVVAGWIVTKGRKLGNIGSTGYSSGPHVHTSVHRGTYAGNGNISGESLPYVRWPSTNDALCNNNQILKSKNWSGTFSIGIGSGGCP